MMYRLTAIHTEAGHKFMIRLLISLNHEENMYFSKSAKRSNMYFLSKEIYPE